MVDWCLLMVRETVKHGPAAKLGGFYGIYLSRGFEQIFHLSNTNYSLQACSEELQKKNEAAATCRLRLIGQRYLFRNFSVSWIFLVKIN
jgi:hypothetical protein